jgi:hypothetical protein
MACLILDLFNLCASINLCQYVHLMNCLLFSYAFSETVIT